MERKWNWSSEKRQKCWHHLTCQSKLIIPFHKLGEWSNSRNLHVFHHFLRSDIQYVLINYEIREILLYLFTFSILVKSISRGNCFPSLKCFETEWTSLVQEVAQRRRWKNSGHILNCCPASDNEWAAESSYTTIILLFLFYCHFVVIVI